MSMPLDSLGGGRVLLMMPLAPTNVQAMIEVLLVVLIVF
jgi:hypothetical protein